MYRFHTTVHARSPRLVEGPPIEIGNRHLATLAATAEELYTPYPITFETAAENLGRLAGLYCEPDGSLVWRSRPGVPGGQIDGHLYDRQGRLLYVELKGTCPVGPFDELLGALTWPETGLVFQLIREAVVVDEAEFRRWAAAALP